MAVGFDPGENPLPVDGFPIRRGGSVFYNKDPDPSGKGPKLPRHMKGKWDESSVEHDLLIIEETKKVLDAIENAVEADESVSTKENLRRELGKLGWIYSSKATFKSNFPFRNKYLALDLLVLKDDLLDLHRIKVVISDNRVSGYKLMKWVAK